LDSINPISYFKTAGEILAFSPELVIMKFWMPFFAPALGTVAARLRKRGVRVITILDNLIPHERRPGDMRLLRYFLKRNDGFIVMSKTVQTDLLHLKPEAKFILKPHPLYDHFGSSLARPLARARLNLPTDKKIALFFGFIREYKGLDNLIKATAHLSGEYCVVVAGEMYGDFGKYQALIDKTETAGKLKLFVRYIEDSEVPLFFSAADVCVLPYKTATQSGIVQIAFNFNLPVIVTDVGGLSEMVEEGETGLIIRSPAPEDLAEKIDFYFAQGLRDKMSNNIAQRRQSYAWPGFAEAVLELCEQLTRR
jgi:glycosyltransferase involved in cell wall biosynthesis